MDTDVASLSPAALPPEAAGFSRAALPGEAVPPGDAGAPPGPAPAEPRRRGRKLLPATAAVLVAAAVGGVFLISPYNTVFPVDAGHLSGRARDLAASVGVPLPPPAAPPARLVVAPAAKLAASARPEREPVHRADPEPSGADDWVARIQTLHAGPAARPGGALPGAPGRSEARPEARHPAPPTPALQAPSPGPVAEVGAAPEPATVPLAAAPTPARPGRPQQPPLVAPVSEPGLAPPGAAASSAATPPAPRPPSPVEAGAPSEGDAPAAPAAAPGPDVAPSAPAFAAVVTVAAQPAAPASPALQPPAPVQQAEPVAVAVELRAAPMARAEQVEVLGLVTKLGAAVRDMRAENATMRAGQRSLAAAVEDLERRLALAEARAAVAAAVEADPGVIVTAAPAAPAPVPSAPVAPRAGRAPAAPVQPVLARVQLSGSAPVAPAPGGPRRWKVQAASPGLAMLSELDRSGGEGSQLQVQVGDQVPGYGKIIAIQQRGATWVVQTTAGAIQ